MSQDVTDLAPELPPLDSRDATGRVLALTDPGSFVELGSRARHHATGFGMAAKRPPGDGVVTGLGRIDGRDIALFAQDPTVIGGSLGETHARKITRVLDHADRSRVPVVGLLDSGGARIQEGVGALDGYGEIFARNVALSGKVPQISVVLGTCAGGAVYSPALTDVVIMRRGARMFLTGPRVVHAVTHEDVGPEELGGVDVHTRRSGVVHLECADAAEGFALARRVLGYLPASCWEPAPVALSREPEPMPEVPSNPRLTFDVRGVARAIVDGGSFLELQPDFARNVVIGFARLDGMAIGVIANQPRSRAGTLDISSAEKAARFVRMCDAFGLPMLTLVDTPGFLPGTAQESAGVIRKGAKLLHAYANATVPRVTVVLRKAFGGAYIVMNSRSLGADAVFAWPTAELAVMGPEGAVDVIHRRELAADPASRDELIERYRSTVMSAEVAAGRLSVDEVITPERTRQVVSTVLRARARGMQHRYRHDNLPQ
ncbi:acyl-CoA carboxylase subunit beta [Amycolatopsis magusensis]|uniref:Propionyl-CoA carboxylase beta chain n=1 Tax=Amycolatopsis magusensis TaxID=882444 RepID=A0ABS4PZN1_9PSEU|nr:acyl-CoA carboxylase subunit beta [Amycolatopsis magusensis]MBP2184887.1 propionyl-CoA carboxylase beta chain [Amycolatopsis magusensis]